MTARSTGTVLGAMTATVLILLAGCGSKELGNQAHPGAAATVGDVEIGLDDVDDLAVRYCDVFLVAGQGASVPMRLLRSDAVRLLTAEQIATQYANENRLTFAPVIRWFQAQAMADAEQRGLTAVQARTFAQVAYEARTQGIYLVAGGGTVPGPGEQPDQQALAAGEQKVAEWATDLEIEVDPRFAGFLPEGGMDVDAGSLSQPVSDLAQRAGQFGENEELNEEYLAELPASQKCVRVE